MPRITECELRIAEQTNVETGYSSRHKILHKVQLEFRYIVVLSETQYLNIRPVAILTPSCTTTRKSRSYRPGVHINSHMYILAVPSTAKIIGLRRVRDFNVQLPLQQCSMIAWNSDKLGRQTDFWNLKRTLTNFERNYQYIRPRPFDDVRYYLVRELSNAWGCHYLVHELLRLKSSRTK